MKNTSVNKAFSAILKELPDRQREILIGRFGLKSADAETETLEELGGRYGITRERVRQIEAAALKNLSQKIKGHQVFDAFLTSVKKHLKSAGGVLSENNLVKLVSVAFPDANKNQMKLVSEVSGEFGFHLDDKNFLPFYFADEAGVKLASGFVSQWVSFVKSRRGEILSGQYEENLKDFSKGKNVPFSYASNFLAVSKKISSNPYGEVGLVEWPEIVPKTIRDRIYLVLNKNKKPLHFTEIAKTINETKFDKKVALASTVHNELIKDNRFVLVGRGLYGLREHGYEPGTAKEVIHKILKKHGPLKPKQVIEAVNKERFFKYNTILVNLQNKNLFERLVDGSYRVRQS